MVNIHAGGETSVVVPPRTALRVHAEVKVKEHSKYDPFGKAFVFTVGESLNKYPNLLVPGIFFEVERTERIDSWGDAVKRLQFQVLNVGSEPVVLGHGVQIGTAYQVEIDEVTECDAPCEVG